MARLTRAWADGHATVTPSSEEAAGAAAARRTERGGGPDSGRRPFWGSWAARPTSRSSWTIRGDGLPEDGPADDAVSGRRPPAAGGSVGSPWSPRSARTPSTPPARGHRPAPGQPGAPVGRTRGCGPGSGGSSSRSSSGWSFGILLLDWRCGLTLAVLAAIADTIYPVADGVPRPGGRPADRAPSGGPAAAADQPGAQGLPGHAHPAHPGQRGADRPPGGGPAGVFAIDSEAWDKRMPVRTSSHRQLWHGPHSKKDRLEHAHWEADQAAELLSAASWAARSASARRWPSTGRRSPGTWPRSGTSTCSAGRGCASTCAAGPGSAARSC